MAHRSSAGIKSLVISSYSTGSRHIENIEDNKHEAIEHGHLGPNLFKQKTHWEGNITHPESISINICTNNKNWMLETLKWKQSSKQVLFFFHMRSLNKNRENKSPPVLQKKRENFESPIFEEKLSASPTVGFADSASGKIGNRQPFEAMRYRSTRNGMYVLHHLSSISI